MSRNGVVSLTCTLLVVFFLTAQSATFTNDWIVRLKKEADPDLVAREHGFENKGQVLEDHLEDAYHFSHLTLEKRHSVHRRDVTDQLNRHEMILVAEQDEILDLHKRGPGLERRSESDSSDLKIEQYNDPYWKDEWFLNSEESGVFTNYEYNINVQPAWDEGFNGTGVVVCVIDDGLEKEHADLVKNYDPKASTDLQGDDDDPSPRYASNEPNRHGTRCAGEIAGERNNSVCGIGVAHGANIGGIRILDGPVTRMMESKALGFATDYIDIFSASWGPPDNGKAMDGPKGITSEVLENAIKKGRGGKGTIYVWAGGNGGKNDDCNADGYQTMRWSVSIGAVGLNGDTPYYAEPCASALASTFSSGYIHGIATTDIHGGCTRDHSGTSAAAPIAAGIIALVLQAQPELTWRDVQHVIIRAAVPDKLFYHGGWIRNGAGRAAHIHFGYGLIDATLAVQIAKNWENVGKDNRCQSPSQHWDRAIPPYDKIELEIEFDGCPNTEDEVNFMEHVYLQVTIDADNRGDITVNLTSPAGTNIQLISTRRYDSDNVGFKDWRLMTVFYFGEDPTGTWKITIQNKGKFIAELKTMFLDVYGTKDAPVEANIPSSDDETVCAQLCELGFHSEYKAKERCDECQKNVEIDVKRRSEIPMKRTSIIADLYNILNFY